MELIIEYEASALLDFDYKKVITDIVEEALSEYKCPFDSEISVTLTDNKRIQEVNESFRGINQATDVLSFPMLEYEIPGDFSNILEDDTAFNPDTGNLMLGDIMISVDKVISQAEAYNHSAVRELAFLTAHSMLHLFGFDHMEETERIDMEARQELLLKNKGYTRTMV